MGYRSFTHNGKPYQADDKGRGVMYVTIEGDSLKLSFTESGISVEKLNFKELQNKAKSKDGLTINYDYNLCVDCNGLKCNTDTVETNCGNLKKA